MPLNQERNHEEGQLSFYLTSCWENKGVHDISKGIGTKMSVIAQMEFELIY